MDICLNISSSPAAGASAKAKQKTNFFKPHMKRLAKKSKAAQKEQSTPENKAATTKSSNFTAKPRIKQKALATIVAKNVARTKKIIHKNANTEKSVKTVRFDESSGVSKNVTPSEPIVKFTKPTKDNALTTIIARAKKDDANKKKSLADIFSNDKNGSGTQLLLTNQKTDGAGNVQGDKFQTMQKENSNKSWSADKVIKKKQEPPVKPKFTQERTNNARNKGNYSKNRNEKQDYPTDEQENSNNRNNKFEKPYNPRPMSKISSLFGNNPEVPNIGQRFVKPVTEAVFSKSKFEDLGVHPYTISNLQQNMNISNATTVQQKAIPVILSGKNVLIRSQTGSGKTLSYALPIVESLHKIRPKLMRNCGIRALVVVPTRELALQTYEIFLKLVKPFTWIVSGYLVGGEKRKAEKARLRKGCAILIATPGRLLDHIIHTEALRLNDVKCFVLDEADRMLDMGYEKDIAGIVEALKRQSDATNTYDPLALVRGQGKKNNISETPAEEEPKESEKVSDDSQNNDEDSESSDTQQQKAEYHSGTDSECDEKEFSIRRNKLKNASGKQENDLTAKESTECSDQSSRQTILLSATLTAAVEKLAGLTMTNPVLVDAAQDNLNEVGGSLNEINEDLVVPQGVNQSYIVTPPKLRMVTLSALIAGKCQSAGQHKILVFMATQDMIDYHADILSTVLGKPSDENDDDSDPLVDVEFFKLHGSMKQNERTEVFKTFRKARSGVLLCTDVAARGLDMPKVDTVVQYNGPLSARDYVHRIGRTARAGSSGVSTIFLTPSEIDFVRMLESRRIRIKQEDMNDVLGKLMGPLSKHNTVESTATALQNEFETLVLENKKFHSKACKAYVSWVRFYASYPREMREVFNRKDLHLGHYAKSFALRDPPQKIGGIGKTLREKEPSKIQHNNRLSNERPAKQPQKRPNPPGSAQRPGMLKKSRMLNTSEYGDGLEPIKKPKKTR